MVLLDSGMSLRAEAGGCSASSRRGKWFDGYQKARASANRSWRESWLKRRVASHKHLTKAELVSVVMVVRDYVSFCVCSTCLTHKHTYYPHIHSFIFKYIPKMVRAHTFTYKHKPKTIVGKGAGFS